MRWFMAVSGLIVVLVLASCGSSSGSPGAARAGASADSGTADTIVITNFMFQPASLTVSPGALVHVRNEDSVTHTLTDKADPGLFNTGDIPPGQTRTFKAPGTAGSYPYICAIHQFMSGTLVVR